MAKRNHWEAVTAVKLADVPRGEFFTLKDYGENPDSSRVYVRDEYNRETRKYGAYRFDDVNHYTEYKRDRVVYVGFTF